MNVIKRDGTIQSFDFSKILTAVAKAFGGDDVPDKFLDQLRAEFDWYILNNHDLNVDEIHNIIQKLLIKKNKYDIVERFIWWRKKREEIRENSLELIKDITKALQASDVQNQNANLDEASFGGRFGEAARVVCKRDALKKMNKKARYNHENNRAYTHDLDSYSIGMHNCLSIPFDHLLKYGFTTRQVDIRPAGSINTALQLVAVIFQLQSLQQFGGVSATHLDWTLVPYVQKSYKKNYWYNYIKLNSEELDDLDILNMTHAEVNRWVEKEVTNFYAKYPHLTDADFTFDNVTTLDKHIRQLSLLDTKKEVYQAAEGMYHNLNSLQSRSGNQLPFTSINLGTCTSLEGRMVSKAIIEVCQEGLGPDYSTSIFPCVIFQCKKGINRKPGDINYDLYRMSLKSTAMRIYPNYANADWSNQQSWKEYDVNIKKEVINSLNKENYEKLVNNLTEDLCQVFGIKLENGNITVLEEEQPFEMFSTMGCRTANGGDVNFKHSFEMNIKSIIEGTPLYDNVASAAAKDGRGNICPSTIILPTLAMEALTNVEKRTPEGSTVSPSAVVDEFMKILAKTMEETKDALIERFNHICSQPAKAATFMWDNNTMYGYVENEGIGSAMRHGTLAMGQIGLSETLYLLINQDQTTDKGMELAKKIESFYLETCNKYKKQYSLNFGVYYTPAESLCHTSFKKWRAKYGDRENITYFIDKDGNRHDKEYFTNSIHVPVYKNVDMFKKIDIESQLTGFSSAGCITYVEMPASAIHNIDALEEIVNYAMDHDIPYFALNFKLDKCRDCGHTGEFNGVCPKCGSTNIDELRRVTGYLSTTKKHFNKGKQHECDDRVAHNGQVIC